MKIEDVPQDSGFFKDTVIRDVAYAVDENGNYRPVISEGWEVKNDALGLAWDMIGEKCEKIREQVSAGKTSPLAYHMEKNLMSIGLLSDYTGFPKRQIKKHLRPDVFTALDEKTLQKYADTLRISVDELKKI